MNVQLILDYFINMISFGILVSRLPNLFLHFDQLLSIKVPKLLESYGWSAN